jgi:hypothetical protein
MPTSDEFDATGQIRPSIATIARAVLNLPPGGGVLASLWSDLESGKRLKRIEEALRAMRAKIDGFGPSFDWAKIGEPEIQLLDEMIERVKKEHREHRRKAFGRLTASCWKSTADSFDDRKVFYRALDEFSDLHISVLIYLKEHAQQPVTFATLCSEVLACFLEDDRRYRLIPLITSLSTEFGFVRRNGHGKGGTLMMAPLSPEYAAINAEHRITPLGIKFLNFIDEFAGDNSTNGG